jgi:fumarate reductase flavoprotein subunit
MVSGTCAVETKYTDEINQEYTSQQLFEEMYQFSHYTVNGELLRNCVYSFPENIKIFNEMGIDFTLGGDRAGIGFIDVHLFATENKNTIMQTYLEDNFGVEFRFSTEAYAPIMEDGKVAGVYATDADGNVIEIKAKAVILACGGFLMNEEERNKYFGVQIVPFSTDFQTGKGISIAEQAGAYREAQVGLGLTDIVGASEKVGFTFTNPLMMSAFFGNLLVDQNGRRFMNEYELANESMSVGGEALLHVQKYYAIYSQKTIDDVIEKGYYAHIGEPECWPTGSLLYAAPMEGLQDYIDEGIETGWVFKADSIAELAEQAGLERLEETVKAYDEMVASGVDSQYGKPIEMAEAIGEEGPYYLLQFNAGAFNTFGGCRTDEKTRALTSDFSVIPGLYIAGVENGSLYARPYYFIGGTCSGLAYSSGRLAGQEAVAYVASL